VKLLARGRWGCALAFVVCVLLPAGVVLGMLWMIRMPGQSYRGPLPPLTDEEVAIRDRLARHVEALAGTIGRRHVWRPRALEQAGSYVEECLRGLDLEVGAQAFEAQGETVRNIEAERRGLSLPEQIVLVGAHYDTVPETPGADDNASGVAALLEMARLLPPGQQARSVRFVAFVNEEPPFFRTGAMGSRVYARRCRERGEDLVAVLVLESVGYYADTPGSQSYPFPFSLLYPHTGDFAAFVGNVSSGGLVRRVVGAFRAHATLPSEGGAIPGWIPGIGWSDHWAFWREGYPALMVTDTAPFRHPHYHTAEDTPETLDFDRMARLVVGLAKAVAELAGPSEPGAAR
jgi:hypothetical protein